MIGGGVLLDLEDPSVCVIFDSTSTDTPENCICRWKRRFSTMQFPLRPVGYRKGGAERLIILHGLFLVYPDTKREMITDQYASILDKNRIHKPLDSKWLTIGTVAVCLACAGCTLISPGVGHLVGPALAFSSLFLDEVLSQVSLYYYSSLIISPPHAHHHIMLMTNDVISRVAYRGWYFGWYWLVFRRYHTNQYQR
jgi:hypothetical protein